MYHFLVLLLGRIVTVSAKVSEEVKKKAEELGINISALVRRALEDEIRRRELQGALRRLRDEVEGCPELPEGTVVEVIRRVRGGRALVC